MRRTARALAVAALAAAAFATAPEAFAKPAAQSGPGPARTGGTVTVSASCDTVGGVTPDMAGISGTADASPPAADGTATNGACTADRGAWDEAAGGCAGLQPCDGVKAPEPASPDCAGEPACAGGTIPGGPDDGRKTKGGSDGGKPDGGSGGSGKTEDGSSDMGHTPGGGDGSSGMGDLRGSGDGTGKTDGGWDGSGQTGSGDGTGKTDGGWDGSGQTGSGDGTGKTDGGWDGGGQTGSGDGTGKTDGGWDGGGQADGGHDCAEPGGDPSCAPPTIGHGVNAGEGGAFAGSLPALVAGAVLIAASGAGAVHRMRRRTSGYPGL